MVTPVPDGNDRLRKGNCDGDKNHLVKPIPKIDHYSCLGVNMDERMSWEKHVECICSKVSVGIGAMRRLKPFVPLSTLKMLYI